MRNIKLATATPRPLRWCLRDWQAKWGLLVTSDSWSTKPLFVFLSFLIMPHSLQGLSFPTRDPTQATAVKAASPNHWTAREFPATVGFLRDFHTVLNEGQKGRKHLFPSPREGGLENSDSRQRQPFGEAFSPKGRFWSGAELCGPCPHVLLLPLVCGKTLAKEYV